MMINDVRCLPTKKYLMHFLSKFSEKLAKGVRIISHLLSNLSVMSCSVKLVFSFVESGLDKIKSYVTHAAMGKTYFIHFR